MSEQETIDARFVERQIAAQDFDNGAWATASRILISRYWSGELAPIDRHAEAHVIWTPDALMVRFECNQAEPLIVNATPQTEWKTLGLWNRDVCEIFVAPDVSEPNRYLEFEAAPTGEWIDLALLLTSGGRETDWEFRSGMTAAARIASNEVTIAMRIPWSKDLPKPQQGDEWAANLCRCVGVEAERGYLAWRPTYTEKPNFHLPSAFGPLRFV